MGRRRQRLQHGLHALLCGRARSRTSRARRATASARSRTCRRVANPYTGVNIYDSTANPAGYPTGWGVWGGTSLASPVVASEFAPRGWGARRRVSRARRSTPTSATSSALYDVVSGHNGSCTRRQLLQGDRGYDGPTGVGSPIGLSAFAPAAKPATSRARRSISGTAEQGQTLTAAHGEWSNSPSAYSEQWTLCATRRAPPARRSRARPRRRTRCRRARWARRSACRRSRATPPGSGSPAVSTQTRERDLRRAHDHRLHAYLAASRAAR